MKRCGAGGMAQWLGALANLTGQVAITPYPGDLMASSDLHGRLQHTHTSTHADTYTESEILQQNIKLSSVYAHIS